MGHRPAALVAAALACSACGACGPETTSFRTTDHSDTTRFGPPSAAYDVYLAGQLVARAHVWSTGGFISASDEPMTHVGFEISNAGNQSLMFDGDALELVAFDSDGDRLPPPRLTAITPRGPSLVMIPPGDTIVLAAYFLLPVRPRNVIGMEARWMLRTASDEVRQLTGFLRDDDAPILERVPPAPRSK
ncbi:MAG: hypothetical protein E6J90_31060 [Deltaproteobacteria bacterium]|nr:MAG: hypothetical protein E6J90_31060 [Deltaproteobacteria bacterium]